MDKSAKKYRQSSLWWLPVLVLVCSHAIFLSFAPIHVELDLLAQSDDIRKYDLVEQRVGTASVAQIGMISWVLPYVFVRGLIGIPHYSTEKWRRSWRRNPSAMRLLTSVWMHESGLATHYYRMHGFKSKPPRFRLPLTGNVAHMIPDAFTRNW